MNCPILTLRSGLLIPERDPADLRRAQIIHIHLAPVHLALGSNWWITIPSFVRADRQAHSYSTLAKLLGVSGLG